MVPDGAPRAAAGRNSATCGPVSALVSESPLVLAPALTGVDAAALVGAGVLFAPAGALT